MAVSDRPVVERPQDAGYAPGAYTHGAAERLIVVSNRGPIEYSSCAGGQIVARHGAGGVVSALLCALRQRPVTWIALAMSAADRAVARGEARAEATPSGLEHVSLRLVDVPENAYDRYYNGISNRVLWFAQHYLLTPASTRVFSQRTEHAWERGYVPVNERVADAVITELEASEGHVPVLFQDYHLYLAPTRVRACCPWARLAHFIHIPWPDARYWEMLPRYLVAPIFAGLAANDVIGFQTVRDARNFLHGAQRLLTHGGERAHVHWDATGAGTLVWQGRRITVQAFPIAVTPEEVRRSAATQGSLAAAVQLGPQLNLSPEHKLILRVDRVEPTKNIVRGFAAYDRVLREHPELRGRVTFLALLVPSRQGMAQYQAYDRQVCHAIERVNARYGQPGWQPIVAIFGNDRARALACMLRYDVLLVNPVIDGMNLVVKEGGLVNRRHGAIVLSQTAGAYEQLAKHVLSVSPLDERATAQALYAGLTMPEDERVAHARAVRSILEAESASTWLQQQIGQLPAWHQGVSRARVTAAGVVQSLQAWRMGRISPMSPAASRELRQPLRALPLRHDGPRAMP